MGCNAMDQEQTGRGHNKSTLYANEFTRPVGRARPRRRAIRKWPTVQDQIDAFRRGEIGYTELQRGVPDDN